MQHSSKRNCLRLHICAFFSFFAIMFLMAMGSSASAKSNPKYASFVMDADTGVILSQRYADKRLHPASLTKMMTLYMTFNALQSGKLQKGQRIWISYHAASMVPSKLGLKPRSTIRVEDAIYALVTKSANDVAVALAEAIGGSESRFSRMMTKTARGLGMSRTTFKNASGLHHKYQVSTARDMARLSQALLQNHPKYYHYFKTQSFRYKGKTYGNHNRLMKSYYGMDGLKTGYVNASGFNLAASAHRRGVRLIGVVFGGRTSKSRNRHMAQILDKGFARSTKMRYAKGPSILPRKKPGAADLVVASAQMPKPKIAANTVQFSQIEPVSGQPKFDWQAQQDVLENLRAMASTSAGLRVLKALKPKPTQVARAMPKRKPSQPSKSEDMEARLQSRQDRWAIQVGSFKSKRKTNKLLNDMADKLPSELVAASEPIIAPLKTRKGMMYRARFSGLDKLTATRACKLLQECLVVSMR